MYRWRGLAATLAAAALVMAACGDGDGDDGASDTEPVEQETEAAAGDSENEENEENEDTSGNAGEDATTTAPPTTAASSTTTSTTAASTTSEASTETTEATRADGFPETSVAAFLSQTYRFGSQQGIPDADQLPFPAGTVSAHWYQSDGSYVVVYGGLEPTLALCPGNSIQNSTGFQFVSNAPLNEADCSFAPNVAASPEGVVTCDGYISYVTQIPAGTEGVLYGTIEMMVDGVGIGLTSQALADPANMPELSRDLIDC